MDLIRRRPVELWQSTDYRIRELFESADIMSEGALVQAPEGQAYFGSTTLVLGLVSSGGRIRDSDHALAVRLISLDPHARLRALRIADREARVRAQGELGTLQTALSVQSIKTGVLMRVDVEGMQLRWQSTSPASGASTI